MNKYKKLFANSLIFSVGNFGSKFIVFFMLPFYTTYLSQSEYGQIDLIATTLSLIVPLLTFNIVEAVVRFSLDKKNYNYGEVLTNSFVFIAFSFFILMIIFPFLIKIDFLAEYIFIFYFLFILQSLHTTIKQFSRSIGKIKLYMASDIFYTCMLVILNIFFIYYLRLGLVGYFYAMIISYILDLMFLIIKTEATKYIRIKYINTTLIKKMIVYCIPLIPNNLMWWVLNISDRYLISYYLGLSATGLYAVASKFPSIIASFQSVFFNAWQISAIEEYEDEARNDFYTNVFNILFFSMMLLSSFYIIVNKYVVTILVSDNFYISWKYAAILVLGVVFSSFASFAGTNYIAMKKTKGALVTSLLGAVVNFILNVILIPLYGLIGSSIATLISFFIIWIARVIDTRRYVKVNYSYHRMIFVLLLVIVQLIFSYSSLNQLTIIFINVIIFFVIFFLSFLYLKKIFNVILSRFFKKRT